MAEMMPDGDVVVLPAVGRLAPIENPVDFNECLRKFWVDRAT